MVKGSYKETDIRNKFVVKSQLSGDHCTAATQLSSRPLQKMSPCSWYSHIKNTVESLLLLRAT